MKARSYCIRRPHAVGGSYTPAQIAGLYGFPKVTSGAPQTIALIELGGGYSPAAIAAQFQTWGLPAPMITDLSVDGAVNSYTGDPSSADVEVELDICVAAAVYSYCTGKAASILVVFTTNTEQGFADAVAAVAKSGARTCGISWGAAEDDWATMPAMDAAFAAGAQAGVTYCCASGDSGSSDGERGNHADYPGSSPYVVCCGGTTIVTSLVNGVVTLVNESVWSDQSGDGSGGGYSASESAPGYQLGFIPAGKHRGVPDLAANADPASGYDTPFGVVGGTSAVAPLMAAFFAVSNQAAGHPVGLPNALLYAGEPTCFRDIVAGNNGTYSATKGWDPASGLGSPLGGPLSAALVAAAGAPPVPPIPTPTPTPTPPPPQPAPPPPPPVDDPPILVQVTTASGEVYEAALMPAALMEAQAEADAAAMEALQTRQAYRNGPKAWGKYLQAKADAIRAMAAAAAKGK